VIETELMPRLVVGYTEKVCNKLKSCKAFLKPSFELGPKFRTGLRQVHRVNCWYVRAHTIVQNLLILGRHKVGAEHYRDLRISAFAEWSGAVG
jgi:hypothetical protein